MVDQVTAAYSGAAQKFEASAAFKERAYVSSRAEYDALYRYSVQDPDGFWKQQAERIDWIKPFERVENTSYASRDLHIRWYEGGKLNACYNCVDRHLKDRADQTAFIFEPDDPNEEGAIITYRNLYEEVGRLANVLRNHGVKKGDRVTIYLPMIPEVVYSMLACG